MGVFSAVGLKKTASRSPNREALAIAINELTGLARNVAKAANAVERGASFREQARQNHDGVVGNARAARDQHAEDIMRAARSGEEVPALSGAREQRYAEMDALEALQTAEGVVERLKKEHDDLIHQLNRQRDKLDALAKAVIVDECAEAAYAACEAAALAFNRQIAVASAVQRCMEGPSNEVYQRMRIFSEHTPLTTTMRIRDATPPVEPRVQAMWTEARTILTRNPDSPLPPITAAITGDDRGAG